MQALDYIVRSGRALYVGNLQLFTGSHQTSHAYFTRFRHPSARSPT